jgi:SRSO17 transposase
VIEKIHADIIHVTGAMLPDAVCSAQNIMPPCEVEDTVVHFYLDMSNNIQEASRSYYLDVINEFAEAFQGIVLMIINAIIYAIIKNKLSI